MLAGLQRATGDAVVIMDADLQHPPELLARMLDAVPAGLRPGGRPPRPARGDPPVRTLRLAALLPADQPLDRRAAASTASATSGCCPGRRWTRCWRCRSTTASPRGCSPGSASRRSVVDYRNETRRGRPRPSGRSGDLFNYGVDGLLSFNNRPLRLAIYGGLFLTADRRGLHGLGGRRRRHATGIDVPGYVTIDRQRRSASAASR